MQNPIRIGSATQHGRTSTLREALTQPFHCDLHRLKCRTQKHSINNNRTTTDKKSPEDLSYTARAIRDRFDGKAAPPETVAQASQLFSAAELPFTRKNTMFGANPNIQIVSWRPLFQCDLSKSELQNTIIIATSLLDSTLLYLYPYSLLGSILLYSALLYSTLLYSTLLFIYSSILYSALLYTLLYSTLLCSALPLLCSTLLFDLYPCSTSTSTLPLPLPLPLLYFYFTLFYSALLYSTLLYSSLPFSTLRCSTLLYSTLLGSTLLYLYSTLPHCFTQVPTGHNDLWASENKTIRQLQCQPRTKLNRHSSTFCSFS